MPEMYFQYKVLPLAKNLPFFPSCIHAAFHPFMLPSDETLTRTLYFHWTMVTISSTLPLSLVTISLVAVLGLTSQS